MAAAPARSKRHAQDANPGLGRPGQPRLAVLLDPGHVLRADARGPHQQQEHGGAEQRAEVAPLPLLAQQRQRAKEQPELDERHDAV